MTKKAAAKEATAPETEAPDGPILDLNDADVKKLIKTAKARGYVTYDELNAILPSEEFSTDQIEDVMAQLSEMGINVVEHEEDEEETAAEPAADEDEAEGTPTKAVAKRADGAVATTTASANDRTDDPVRMYLREME